MELEDPKKAFIGKKAFYCRSHTLQRLLLDHRGLPVSSHDEVSRATQGEFSSFLAILWAYKPTSSPCPPNISGPSIVFQYPSRHDPCLPISRLFQNFFRLLPHSNSKIDLHLTPDVSNTRAQHKSHRKNPGAQQDETISLLPRPSFNMIHCRRCRDTGQATLASPAVAAKAAAGSSTAATYATAPAARRT